MQNNNIICDVDSCDYNDSKEGTCTLKCIKVSCTSNRNNCQTSDETVCESFENTGSPITDNVYEVTSEIQE